jgi:ankyrin repeat protein
LIHELCKIISYPEYPECNGEISDDDEDDPKVRRPCYACHKIENKQICDLAQFLIDTSLRLGPTRVAASFDKYNNGESFNDRNASNCSSEICDSILTAKNSYGKTPLHILCEHSADLEMMRVIFANTKDRSSHPCAPSAHSLVTSTDERGSTPLHYLSYSRECPLSALELMMDHCKPALDLDPTLCQDVDGNTPLHWALDGYMSPRRIAQIARHSKAALHVQNRAGKGPFDSFASNFIHPDWRTHDICGREAWENIQEYLKALTDWKEGTSKEWLPLHALASTPLSLPNVFYDIALHYQKDHLSKPDSNGWLPLHMACGRDRMTNETTYNGKLVETFLKEYPQAAYCPTKDTKQLPVHIAVNTKKSWSLISSLLSVYPNSLNMNDPPTNLWPFSLAGSRDIESIDTSFRLLRADPCIMHVAVRNLVKKKGVRAAKALRKMTIEELEEYTEEGSSPYFKAVG